MCPEISGGGGELHFLAFFSKKNVFQLFLRGGGGGWAISKINGDMIYHTNI